VRRITTPDEVEIERKGTLANGSADECGKRDYEKMLHINDGRGAMTRILHLSTTKE